MTAATWTAALLAALIVSPAAAQEPPAVHVIASAQDLKRLTIEELAEIDVTTASRQIQPLSRAAAAMSVIRDEDIRRSGYLTLADIMRLADALDVARVNAYSWAVSARGFAAHPANKLLVMVDGRSVYSPLTSGTFWDVQDYVLADIERIEVIRGPGGALWGANAVNGVINIITRDASATRGTLAALTTGTNEQATAVLRHGGRVGAGGSYRVYGKYRRRASQVFATGEEADNPVQMGQLGFRIDSAEAPRRWTVQGDVYRGTLGIAPGPDGDTAGGNIVGRLTRRSTQGAELRVQGSYDRTFRAIPAQFEETRDTFELDAQRSVAFRGRHVLVAGAGVRVTHGDARGFGAYRFEPSTETDTLVSVFVQDEISLRPERFAIILGTKLERNDFTGLEAQPTARARWTPAGTQTLWGAVSRAVRLPARLDTSLQLIDPETRDVTLEGNRGFLPESVWAYEVGYRVRPHDQLSLDLAAYTNRYDHLRSTDIAFRPGPVIVLGNRLNASTAGVEIAATFHPAPVWRLHGSYARLHKTLSFDTGMPDAFRGTVEGNDPAHLFTSRSYLDLPRGFAFDAILRYAGRRPEPRTPAYTELNLRLGWTARPGWELSLVGQDLLRAYHPELLTSSQRFAFRRGVYLRSAWRF